MVVHRRPSASMPTLPTTGPHVSLSCGTAIDRAERYAKDDEPPTFGVRQAWLDQVTGPR